MWKNETNREGDNNIIEFIDRDKDNTDGVHIICGVGAPVGSDI